jgi:Large eukaryotic DNA virus major capsid protein/Major capsid protein N-terminus
MKVFKIIYKRHTNFACDSIEQTFNGAADFGKKVTCTVSRNGDLINKIYLRVVLPEVKVPNNCAFRWLNWLGHILIKNVEIDIGGQKIDKHYGEWLHIWNELSQTAGHQMGYANMVGNIPQLVTPITNKSGQDAYCPSEILYIPLQFWFCRNIGLSLPLIALQYHEVRINLEMRDVTDCYWAASLTPRETVSQGSYWKNNMNAVSVGQLNAASLYVDYIYLDTEERRRFAQVQHEYLIEQLQFTGDESTSNTNNKFKLNFNHPTKTLVWVVQPDDNVSTQAPAGKQWFNFTDDYDSTYGYIMDNHPDPAFASLAPLAFSKMDAAGNMVDPTMTNNTNKSGTMPGVAAGGANGAFIPVTFDLGDNPTFIAKLQLNGHDRISERDGRYFNLVQPYQCHENVPSRGINVYSFALKPEDYQPTGTCNFSRIDNATLSLTLTDKTVRYGPVGAKVSRTCKFKIFAVNYNVLRIMSGMGGLSYSN